MREVIVITSWLEEEHVARIRTAASWAEVVHEPELLRPPRYASDHTGHAVERDPEAEARWRAHLARATILYDFDPSHREDLPELAHKVRWVQATSAGIGQLVRRMRYGERMPGAVFTTASGVHARPLAEFVLLCMLGHVRGLLPIVRAQRDRHWERFAGTDLECRTALVIGYGKIGAEVGRVVRAFGVRVLGVRRKSGDVDPGQVHADELHGPGEIPDLLPRADFLVLCAPHTDETEGMIGAAELAALPPGAALINIGRGSLVDEPALVEGLRRGRPASAWLDVFAEEPLPRESPLWSMPNVLVSPHSASTSERENGRITDLFCRNLRRYHAGEPLENVLDVDRLY